MYTYVYTMYFVCEVLKHVKRHIVSLTYIGTCCKKFQGKIFHNNFVTVISFRGVTVTPRWQTCVAKLTLAKEG